MIADAVLAIVVGFVLLVLFYIAAFQVITKAGYSGGWLVVAMAPLLLYPVSLLGIARSADPFSSGFSISRAKAWVAFDAFVFLGECIAFFVFAFSNWPVRRQAHEAQASRLITGGPLPPRWSPVDVEGVPSAVGSARTTRCPSCGTGNDSGDAFCGSCGAGLVGGGAGMASFAGPVMSESPPPPCPARAWRHGSLLRVRERATAGEHILRSMRPRSPGLRGQVIEDLRAGGPA